MPTSCTLPRSCTVVWKRPTPVTLQPPASAFANLPMLPPNRSPRPKGSVQSAWNLIAWRTVGLPVTGMSVQARPKLKPSNCDPPSNAY